MRCLPVAALVLAATVFNNSPVAADFLADTRHLEAEARHLAASTREQAEGPQSDKKAIGQYSEAVSARLQKYREYPREAREAGIEGLGIVALEIGRDGAVLTHNVIQSTGHRILDEAISKAVSEASPFPPLPESRAGDSAWFILLQRFEKDR